VAVTTHPHQGELYPTFSFTTTTTVNHPAQLRNIYCVILNFSVLVQDFGPSIRLVLNSVIRFDNRLI
jgi:hypothetical protein